MCECGCSQGPDFYFPGPKGFTYGLEYYRGCQDCGNAPGVSLYQIPAKSLEFFAPVDSRPAPKWIGNESWQEVAVAIVDRELLAEAVKADEDADLLSLSDDDGEISDETASEVAHCAWKALMRVAFKERPVPPKRRSEGED